MKLSYLYFDAFVKGGIEGKEERLKSLMIEKNINSTFQEMPTKDDLDFDLEYNTEKIL